MKTNTIYTNGKSLFTLEDFGKTAGTCEVNEIKKHSEVSDITRRSMHSKGQLHYIFGVGNRNELKGISLKRGMKLKSFKIN